MTEQAEITRVIHRSLTDIAPEAQPENLDLDANLREELDLDSMDFLNFVGALHRAFKIDIAEADYPQLVTLRSAQAYLSSKLSA